jgi:hypothetical protein
MADHMCKSANDKITKCTRRNAYSAPSHDLYGTHENLIPPYTVIPSPSILPRCRF